MKSKQVNKPKSYPLSRLVTIPPKSYASTNIENDTITLLKNYLPSASTIEVIERFVAGQTGAKTGRMLSITGPYGSGKSTMAVFFDALLSNKNDQEWKTAHTILKNESPVVAKLILKAREKIGIHNKGLLRCIVTARREPITVTILRALDIGAKKYFGNYSNKHFAHADSLRQNVQELKKNKIPSSKDLIEIIIEMSKSVPMLIMIDEFGKNVEYFTTDETQQSDLFLLQELAEMSGKGRMIPLSIITLQHMAFEEYAVGATTAQKQEWAKIQGRFEDIPFANSPDQTRILVSNTIQLDKETSNRRIVKNWAKNEAKKIRNLGIGSDFDADLIASCYPLDTLALEILPELCSRYGQYERTLLSFISDAGKYTVATFIDENSWKGNNLPTMGIDMLYDYFISGTSMIHSSSANITRLMEIETIIRDSHGLSDLEIKTLKSIGILNLIGKSGYLRASQKLLDYAVKNDTKQVLKSLEEKSIITYRKYADEYRIWHGTDIDIAAKLDMYRKRYKKSSLSEMLQNKMSLEPIVAAKHSIKTGIMRLFERKFVFELQIKLDPSYDGVIIYTTGNSTKPKCDKPIITVSTKDTFALHHAVIEVVSIGDILENDQEVISDWVARKELEERLADAEILLDREFGSAYGNTAKWSYQKGEKAISKVGTPSEIVSQVCDSVYSQTPRIYNEMVNRTLLSSQGASAKRKLIGDMITSPTELRFGIEGYGPDRAVYEAVFIKNQIHVPDTKLDWKLQDPKDETIIPIWNAMIQMLKDSKKRVPLSKIYEMCKQPPYGMKDGVLAIFMVAILLVHRNNIAMYEHGTYVPAILPETSERMIKNPDYYEFKYFKSTLSKKALLKTVISDLKINSEGSVLDVVGHLVRVISSLPPYVRNTKKLDKNTLAVRNTILSAMEPDTLLFDSLPKALGFKSFDSKVSESDITRFSKMLTESANTLQNEFNKTLSDIQRLLFDATGIDNREKLSKTAVVILESVSDYKIKVFLNAIKADLLEKDEDWIKYVAQSLTDIPPMDWRDEQREMFENSLIDISRKFKRLASIHFSNVSDNFVKPSFQVTVTHADGREHYNVVSLRPQQKKQMQEVADKAIKDMKKKGFSSKDIDALIAILSSKSS